MKSMTGTVAAIFVLLVASESSAIGINPCAFSGNARFTPEHPGPLDTPGYNVSLPEPLFPSDLNRQIVTKSAISANGAISIDVVITENPALFPDYKLVNVKYRADSTFEYFGPLTVGDHQVSTDVRILDVGTGNYVSVCGVKSTVLSVLASSAPVQTSPVVEFYNQTLDHYFITQNVGEISDLDRGVHPGWSRTGQSFLAYLSDASDGRGHPTCRWYGLPSAGLDTHVQSASLVECNAILVDPLTKDRWQPEAQNVFEIALPDTTTGVCPAKTQPVYRLGNQRADSNHRYTTDPAVRAAMLAKGYVSEGFGPDGVAMCSPTP